ncbi:hypothetical protein [Nocardia puris]|uniref:Uncharacterized protein n=1 Tax=Nocardia puris TaxID=208602 RepID=A0A366DPF7_9NOCA|nr:hypothetical protein [Nocardia puris]RBO91339.1 hypothetical protein DFR74_10441 [Nocardia puris]
MTSEGSSPINPNTGFRKPNMALFTRAYPIDAVPHPTEDPLVWWIPSTEARPGARLPDASLIIAILSRAVNPPPSLLLRTVLEFLPVHVRLIYEPDYQRQGSRALQVLTMVVDREAAGRIRGVDPEPAAPLCPSSYGDHIAHFVRIYIDFMVHQQFSDLAGRARDVMYQQIHTVNRLAVDTMAGRLRLPRHSTAARIWPPRLTDTQGDSQS